MKFRGQIAPRKRGMRGLDSAVAALLTIMVASMLSGGCGETVSAMWNTSVTQSVAVTTTSLVQTTTSTLYMHGRVRQEQAALGAADAASSPTTLARVMVLSDGKTMTREEFDATQSYVDAVTPLMDEQSRLTVELDSAVSFDYWKEGGLFGCGGDQPARTGLSLLGYYLRPRNKEPRDAAAFPARGFRGSQYEPPRIRRSQQVAALRCNDEALNLQP